MLRIEPAVPAGPAGSGILSKPEIVGLTLACHDPGAVARWPAHLAVCVADLRRRLLAAIRDVLPQTPARVLLPGFSGNPAVDWTLAHPLDQALKYRFLASSASTGGQGRHDDTSVLLLER